jgi:hypothetical protein
VGGVRAVLTGGTGPLISVAVNQGAGKALEFVPQSLLRPIAEGADKINRFVGDGGSSFLLGKDFAAVSNDNSDPTRTDSNATTFGVTTLFGVSLAPIVNKAKALFKRGGASNGGTGDVDIDTPPTPKRIYSARELARRAEEPGPNHNFPGSFDDEIFKGNKRVISPTYTQYELRGTLNGRSGTYEIGVRPSSSGRNEVIVHRFFRPDPK